MDEATLRFYGGNADAYAGREITSRKARLTAFLAQLPPAARILELGCGAGGDADLLLDFGRVPVGADRIRRQTLAGFAEQRVLLQPAACAGDA